MQRKLSVALATALATSLVWTAGAQSVSEIADLTGSISATEIARINSGDGEGGAEIPAYHAGVQRIYATNGVKNAIDVYDIADPTSPKKLDSIALDAYGDGVTSVAAGKNVVVAAVTRSAQFSEAGQPTTRNGRLVVMDLRGRVQSVVDVRGVLPDAVTFTPNGYTAVVAIEGEPVCAVDNPATENDESADYSLAADPKGGISIVDLTVPKMPKVRFAGFSKYTVRQLRSAGLAMSSVVNNAAKDLEPEYVTAPTNDVAFVSLQEANGIAQVNLRTGQVESVKAAYKTGRARVPLDPSDKDKGKGLRTYANVVSSAQPDALASFTIGSDVYFVSANEGDARDYTCISDDVRASSLSVDSRRFPTWDLLSASAELGRAKVDPNIGDTDGDGDIDIIHLRGGRSMTVYRNGSVLADTGAMLEQVQETMFGTALINGSHDSDGTNVVYTGQGRSDDKGAEPEGVAVGMVDGRRVAVLGLERMSALVLFDITDPAHPSLESWISMQPLTSTPLAASTAWSPEGVLFVPASKSPNGRPLVITSYELSGSITIHELSANNDR